MAGSVNVDGTKRRACAACGNSFGRPPRLSSTQWARRRFCSKRCSGLRRRMTEREMVAEYQAGRSSPEISERAGVSAAHIRRILAGAGLDRRSLSDALKISHNQPERATRFSEVNRRPLSEAAKEKLRARSGPRNGRWRSGLTVTAQGYLAFTRSPANGAHAGQAIHRVIGEWMVGRRLRRDEHVHHIDGNKLNNDPHNLLVMPASEHARLHAGNRKIGSKGSC